MILQESDNIKVNKFYVSSKYNEFLGYIPVLDHDTHSYYTVQNDHEHKNFERVSPIMGRYDHELITEVEEWYFRQSLPPKSREEDVLRHELYRDEYIERFSTHKYCVWFIGCDDGDSFMRFESKESALEFLSNIDFFDEIYIHPHRQMW